MNKNLFIWFCVLLHMMLFCSCDVEEYINLKNHGEITGELEYSWSRVKSGDTTVLYCEQKFRYKDGSTWQTINMCGTVKIYPKFNLIEYDSTDDLLPYYKTASSSEGYEGDNPRYRTIYQEIFLDDEQAFIVDIRYPLYSYRQNGRLYFYPYVELMGVIFKNASIRKSGALDYADVTFYVPWKDTSQNISGNETLEVSYAKKKVEKTDKLLSTETQKGIKWVNDGQFYLYVKKIEVREISGTNVFQKTSPNLSFLLTSSGNKTVDVSNFDFNGKLSPSQDAKEDLSNSEWTIKRSMTTQTVMFSNKNEYFEDVFSYPFYEASLNWNGEKFSFDLSIDFKENWQIDEVNTSLAKNTTTAMVQFADRNFRKSVITTMNKKSDPNPDPDPQSPYGKVLGYAVAAVFDPAAFTNGGSITKKCVLIHFEKGYYWGICAYDKAFPTNFSFTQSRYGYFDSAAKRNANSEFELARAVQSSSTIKWYDQDNKQISGIDALTCMIYGWANIVDGNYASAVTGYTVSNKTDYSITLKAPDGTQKKF